MEDVVIVLNMLMSKIKSGLPLASQKYINTFEKMADEEKLKMIEINEEIDLKKQNYFVMFYNNNNNIWWLGVAVNQ